MTGSWSIDRRCRLSIVESIISIGDLHDDWCPGRHPVPDTCKKDGGIGLDPLPSSAAIPALSAGQLGGDERFVDHQTRGHPRDHRHHIGSVRLTCSVARQWWHGDSVAAHRRRGADYSIEENVIASRIDSRGGG